MSILNKIIKKEEEDNSKNPKAEKKEAIKKVVKTSTKKSSGDSKKASLKHFDMIVRPYISEKAFDANEKRQYVFVVSRDSNKTEIKKAIENFYKVSVESVNIIKAPGKVRRKRGVIVRQSGIKKAVVTLNEGNKLDVMEVNK